MLQELEKLPQKELAKILDKNKWLNDESIALYETKLVKILKRDKNSVWAKEENKTPFACNADELIPFTYSEYINLKTKKYQTGEQIKTIQQLYNFITHKLIALYGEENVDIYVEYDTIVIKLYFSTINITNSLGMIHTMTDVYLQFRISISRGSLSFYLNNIKLFRETFTPGEVYSRYLFSHTSSDPGKCSEDFCFGSTIFSRIVNSYFSKINPTQIIPFILSFKNYLEWESLEGVPYRKIETIKEYKISKTSIVFPSEYEEEVFKKLLSRLENFNYSIELNNGDYTFSPQLNEQISTILKDIFIEDNKLQYVGKSIGNEFGNPELINSEEVEGKLYQHEFYFKDELKKSRIVEISEKSSEALFKDIPDTVPIYMIETFSNIIRQKFNIFITNYNLNKYE